MIGLLKIADVRFPRVLRWVGNKAAAFEANNFGTCTDEKLCMYINNK